MIVVYIITAFLIGVLCGTYFFEIGLMGIDEDEEKNDR